MSDDAIDPVTVQKMWDLSQTPEDNELVRRVVANLASIDRRGLHQSILRELGRLAETASHLREDDEGPDSILYAGYLDDLILDCRVLTYAVENAIRYPRQP